MGKIQPTALIQKGIKFKWQPGNTDATNPPARRSDDDLWKLVQDARDAMAEKKRSVKTS